MYDLIDTNNEKTWNCKSLALDVIRKIYINWHLTYICVNKNIKSGKENKPALGAPQAHGNIDISDIEKNSLIFTRNIDFFFIFPVRLQ